MKSKRLTYTFLKDIKTEKVLELQKRNFDFWSSKSPERVSNFLTSDYWNQQVLHAKNEFDNDSAYRFLFSPISNSELVIGYVNFSQIFRGTFQACYVGYAIDENFQGEGLTTEALEYLIQYMFEQKNIHRVMANYMPENTGSAKVLEKVGFVIEGSAKEYLNINGKWEDHILTSLTNKNWT